MGYNTTVVVMNDALDQIKNDPEFGRKLAEAVTGLSVPERRRDVSAGNHANAATVIETHHADQVHAIAVGGNRGVNLGYAGNWRQQDNEMELLTNLAIQLGYDLVKRKQ